jgi:hypothetical protein
VVDQRTLEKWQSRAPIENSNVSINIELDPPPPATNTCNISGGSRAGQQLTDFKTDHHRGRPHKRSRLMVCSVPQCQLEFEGVFACPRRPTSVLWRRHISLECLICPQESPKTLTHLPQSTNLFHYKTKAPSMTCRR